MSIQNESWKERVLIARQGRSEDLDVLVNDTEYQVRATVARHVRCKLT